MDIIYSIIDQFLAEFDRGFTIIEFLLNSLNAFDQDSDKFMDYQQIMQFTALHG